MTTLSLRLPASLHERLRDLAAREAISIHQLITLAAADKVASILTLDHLAERARRQRRQGPANGAEPLAQGVAFVPGQRTKKPSAVPCAAAGSFAPDGETRLRSARRHLGIIAGAASFPP